MHHPDPARLAHGLIVALALTACADSSPGPRLTVNVAPLSLPDVGIACYDLQVSNGTSTVWAQGVPALTRLGADQTAAPGSAPSGVPDTKTICSDKYGNSTGGDIAFVGPCDAQVDSDGNALNGVQNRVTVWVDGLFNASGTADVGEWQDPCPNGCSINVDCKANVDSVAAFDLTVMRAANQGFFDVAVNFQDVFCSAKLDTCYGATPIEQDFFGGDNERDWTAVFGFACTAGVDAADTNLLYGPVAVDCGAAGVFDIEPALAPGNHTATAAGKTLHYAIYRGDEALACGTGSCAKRYWNLAFDLETLPAGATCRLAFEATANDANIGFDEGEPAGNGLSWPYITVDVPLVTSGAASCQTNPLNGSGSGVKTAYRGSLGGMTAPKIMCAEFSGGAAVVNGFCGGEPDLVLGPSTVACDGVAGALGNLNMNGVDEYSIVCEANQPNVFFTALTANYNYGDVYDTSAPDTASGGQANAAKLQNIPCDGVPRVARSTYLGFFQAVSPIWAGTTSERGVFASHPSSAGCQTATFSYSVKRCGTGLGDSHSHAANVGNKLYCECDAGYVGNADVACALP